MNLQNVESGTEWDIFSPIGYFIERKQVRGKWDKRDKSACPTLFSWNEMNYDENTRVGHCFRKETHPQGKTP
jgi:hypothetical protein